MKFWQFVSVCEELNIQLSSINLDSKWNSFTIWYNNFDSIVDKQDRSILDCLVPNELCGQVFSNSKVIFYISKGYLRRRALGESDVKINALDIFRKYGGEKLEEVLEAGLVKV